MTSAEHQWLLLWVARKMVADGVVLTAFDGPTPQGGAWNDLPRTPQVGAYRPDALGMSSGGYVAFGEAKTEDDIEDPHTIAQLRAFAGAAPTVLVYVAVPRSAAYRLDRVLAKAALPPSTRVVRMHVPDCFVQETMNEFA